MTDMEQIKPTYRNIASSLLDDMLVNIIRQQMIVAMSQQRTLYSMVGDVKGANFLIEDSGSPNKDIFGHDKQKLKSSEISKYFPCDNCGRSIAAGRLSQHMSKCLERKRR
ncbi:Piso0_005382 [Millerozyma farinosa CBS 7064]|uniref:SAGA-associated factor 11 n=1 Tax=Pichia sorbitophila (strain ATCC MYA-4447 / BCRC 22081 / CBS 7064 / NBRC 10061 / NRRL Y-12695) TaxID=559304 RepID=G8Y4Y7_PICSO|nr:Piso0_005382 [Millerozyma farinosa CBS 7064]